MITYERAVGALHMACADRPAERRRNEYPVRCELCGLRLLRGQGELFITEWQDGDGHWRRRWLARCADVPTCNARIRELLQRGC